MVRLRKENLTGHILESDWPKLLNGEGKAGAHVQLSCQLGGIWEVVSVLLLGKPGQGAGR